MLYDELVLIWRFRTKSQPPPSHKSLPVLDETVSASACLSYKTNRLYFYDDKVTIRDSFAIVNPRLADSRLPLFVPGDRGLVLATDRGLGSDAIIF